jgi:pimeloyl-ACP methyl ester carboxylesterase
MTMILRIVWFSINLIVIHFLFDVTIYAQQKGFSQSSNDSTLKTWVSQENFVLINGIEQWVTIKGESSKPAILFLHGGPGSPISPYSDNLYKAWEKDFIIVQWDQRGTGKTFGVNAPDELTPEYLKSNPLTLEQMVTDGIKLSEYLIKHLRKQKIILFGTSWGSALGVKMATKRPDLFYAYVGHSQIVNPADDIPLYNTIYQLAQKNNDKQSLEILTAIGKPPYDKARSVGQLLRITKKYERERSIPPPDFWFVESANYISAKDSQNRSDGDDYSFVNYVGDTRFGVQSIRSTINLMRDNLDFKVPVYLIQGEEDLLIPKEMTEEYFNKIKAPAKEYILLPNTAHGFNFSVVQTQYKIFKVIKVL